jgi:glyceraldehyde-3-phosphate dehydrogenase (NAD(P))
MTQTKRIRVGVNGYGVIGRRVADALRLQSDMELIGVADVASDYRIRTAVLSGIAVYASEASSVEPMRAAGIQPQGSFDDLLRSTDLIVDCTPKGVAARNLERYRAVGVKAVFQGGEKHELTGHSFVAQANYETALGRECTRVVSCNTTSIVRVLGAFHDAGLLANARGVLIRRATDPWEADHSGIMNTIVPEAHVPSHQGPDAQSVRPELDIVTMAAKAAHTQTHNHYWMIRLTRAASREELLAALRAAPRIAFVRMGDGIVALNSTVDLMHDLGRRRGDMWEVAVWEDVLSVQGAEAFLTYQVDNQAIVVPETIDAIRALTGAVRDGRQSISQTDESLGVRREFLAADA